MDAQTKEAEGVIMLQWTVLVNIGGKNNNDYLSTLIN